MMTTYCNKQKLSAVLNRWAQPAIKQLLGCKVGSLPFVANIEAKIKSTGWVSPMWRLGDELSPIIGGLSTSVIEPMIYKYLADLPIDDAAIPEIAHKVVDDAIVNGSLSLFEGAVEFEKEDLEELKTLLCYNLPIDRVERYEVVTDPPKPQGFVVADD